MVRSSIPQSTDGHLAKRGEESKSAINPLKDAFNAFGGDTSHALDGAENILTNIFPKNLANAYVTGLNGHVELKKKSS